MFTSTLEPLARTTLEDPWKKYKNNLDSFNCKLKF